MKKRTLYWSAGITVTPVAWVVSASALYLWFVGRMDLFVFPYWQWFQAVPYWNSGFWMGAYVIGSAAMASIPGACVVSEIRHRRKRKRLKKSSGDQRPVEMGATENHGHARFQTMEEAIDLFPGPHPVWGGIVVGEACEVKPEWGRRFKPDDQSTWGDGGKAPLLIDPCTEGPSHFIIFSGSGWYKTSSLIPTILEWKTSSIVLDVKAEIGQMVNRALEEDHGKTVHFLHPVRPPDAERWGINVLDWIRPDTPTFEEDIRSIVAWIYENPDPGGKVDPFFDPWAKDLIACLLADMLTMDDLQAPRTLATLRRGIATPEEDMRLLLRGIYANSNSMLAQDIAGGLMDSPSRQFGGVYGTAFKATSWLSVPSLADLVSGDAFSPDDVVNGDVSVFIQIPFTTLEHSPGIARVLVGALAKAVMRSAETAKLHGKVLLLLDEARLLKNMMLIEDIRDLGRASGFVLGMTYQTVGQLKEQWGPSGKEKWYSTLGWRGYSSIRDLATAEELAKECGHHGALAYSEGDNSGASRQAFAMWGQKSSGTNTNVHEINVPVAFTHQVLCESRADEFWVVGTGQYALRCSRAIYWRRRDMKARVEDSRYFQLFQQEEEETAA